MLDYFLFHAYYYNLNIYTCLCSNCGGPYGYYTGDQCELLACPSSGGSVCGAGRCVSMRVAAGMALTEQMEVAGLVYELPWDAE